MSKASIMAPYVSVVVPVYNAEERLEETLTCLLSQTVRDLEIVCIEDGSNDRSLEILHSAARRDARLRVVSTFHRGAASARNEGLRLVEGRYVICLDADDIYDPDMLRSMADSLDSHGSDVCICEMDTLDVRTGRRGAFSRIPSWCSDGVHVQDEFCDSFFQVFNNSPVVKMYRRSFVESLGLSYQSLPNTNDMFYSYAACAMARSLSTISVPFVTYRINQGTGSVQDGWASHPFCAFISCYTIHEYLSRSEALTSGLLASLRRSMLGNMVTSLRRAAQDSEGFRELAVQFCTAMSRRWGFDAEWRERASPYHKMVYESVSRSCPEILRGAMRPYSARHLISKGDKATLGLLMGLSQLLTFVSGRVGESCGHLDPCVDVGSAIGNADPCEWDVVLVEAFENRIGGGSSRFVRLRLAVLPSRPSVRHARAA